MARGPMGDSSLLSGVDTSPLYAYYGGANMATDALGGLSKTLNSYGQAKASDATAQAIAAITGADSRDAYSQLDADQLASNNWLSGEQKLNILNQYKAQEETARANDIKKLQQSLFTQLGQTPEEIRNNVGSADFNANAIQQLMQSGANPAEISAVIQQNQGMNQAFKEQEKAALAARIEQLGMQVDSNLNNTGLAQYETADEAARGILGSMDLNGIPLAQRNALKDTIKSEYSNLFGMTEAQKQHAATLGAETTGLLDVAAQRILKDMDDKLAQEGFSRDFIQARNITPEQELSMDQLVKELEPRFGSDADAGKIQKIQRIGKEMGVQFNTQDIKNIYELGSNNNWFGAGSKDFGFAPWESATQTVKDYAQTLKKFNNSDVAATRANLTQRLTSAKQQAQDAYNQGLQQDFQRLNRGGNVDSPQSMSPEALTKLLRGYAGVDALEQSVKAK